jgi:branched-chain amino acid transport system ATP-binding protein
MGESLLQMKQLSRRYGQVPVLDSVSLSLKAGSLTLLWGKNGSGKTTLINCISGFDLSYTGDIFLGEDNINRRSADERARRGVVRTFQQPHLFHDLTVAEHLSLGAVARTRVGKAYLARWCMTAPPDLIAELDLEPLLKRRGSQLSFGEMKVVNTARVLSTSAKVLLLDEPLASLHGGRRRRVLDAIIARRSLGCAVLVIEHEHREWQELADARFELFNAQLRKEGSS